MIKRKIHGIFQQVLQTEEIQSGLQFIRQDEKKFLDDIVAVTRVESPTFQEEKRAEYMLERYREFGLKDAHIDSYGNVMGILPGKDPDSMIVVDAHMDTVFPLGSVKDVIREGDYIKAPGISDDSRGLATQLSLLRAFQNCEIQPDKSILFLGTTREEGLGMLGGMHDFLKDNKESVKAVITIDGEKIPHIVFKATGMTTAEMIFHGVKGHAAMNTANALHACSRAIAMIADFDLPKDIWTSFNVTVCQAGDDAEIHVVPERASFKYNVRSNSAQILAELNRRIENACKIAIEQEHKKWNTETLSLERRVLVEAPADSSQKPDAPIVEAAGEILEWLGFTPYLENVGCTNASWGIAYGIPSICIGMNAVTDEMDFKAYLHNPNEQTYIRDAYKSVQYPWILTWMCAGAEGKIPSILEI